MRISMLLLATALLMLATACQSNLENVIAERNFTLVKVSAFDNQSIQKTTLGSSYPFASVSFCLNRL